MEATGVWGRISGWLRSTPAGEATVQALVAATLIAVPFFATVHFSHGSEWGLPLDDAWIHAAHARNLVEEGRLSIQPGRPGAALTSPVWTVLLAGGYALTRDPVQAVSLLALAVHMLLVGGVYLLLRAGVGWGWALGAAVLSAVTGPLLWNTMSGMETNLLCVAALWACYAVEGKRWRLAAAFAVFALLVRPEGLLLLAPLGWALLVKRDKSAMYPLLAALVGLALFVAWNFVRVGSVLPSTLAAKRWGYGVPDGRSTLAVLSDAWMFLYAWLDYLFVGLNEHGLPAGEGVYLGLALVGVVSFALRGGSGVAWAALFVLLLNLVYAVLLPAQGAAGRYQGVNWLLVPVAASAGLSALRSWTRHSRLRPFRTPIAALLVAIWAFLALHSFVNSRKWAEGYREHIVQIQSVHVYSAARLAMANRRCIPVVAYDIGAIAYFAYTRHCAPKLVDLGGMDTPEAIPSLWAGTALHEAVVAAGTVFLSLPLTLADDILAPAVGLRMVGPAGRKELADPTGRLRIRRIGETSYSSEVGSGRDLVNNNAPEVGMWIAKAARSEEESR